MGMGITQERFTEEDHSRFKERLRRSLTLLRDVLCREGFGAGPTTVGAELEMFLINAQGRAVLDNSAVKARSKDARVCLELNRYNLEGNAQPQPLKGKPFTALTQELKEIVGHVASAAKESDARVVVIGILPTLVLEELGREAISNTPRYRALSSGIFQARNEAPLRVRIDGDDPLELDWDEVSLQGANASFQVHLRVKPDDFARVYNAAQLATGPALALCGNSPLFLGHRLWEETRIALFKQATDDRGDLSHAAWRPMARASFGNGWVRQGALELFEESVALHAPLLPVCFDEPAENMAELRLHHGTVWTWNRAVYDPDGGGHLRIEYRPLPGGPSYVDMAANAALLIGLTLGLAEDSDALLAAMPFAYAERNFYQAAKRGLDAELLWPSRSSPSPRPQKAPALLAKLLPLVGRGLKRGGVDNAEIDQLVGLLTDRLASGQTGARWQRHQVEVHGGARSPDARRKMLELYLERSASGEPVHRWR
ncbi:MAG: glutamate--cysteine ligase [Myxococcaceae bacterium]